MASQAARSFANPQEAHAALRADPLIQALLARCHFPEAGRGAVLAVSGGADSLALLVLACAAGLQVEAVHVDHGLRPGSEREADVVAAAAARFGARWRAVTVSVEPGANLEARARAARYAALPPGVLTGHTLDDLAETVLVNLLRGAALDGLTPFQRPGPVGRPLLDLRRADTLAVCEAWGLEPVVDASNADPRFVRNRVRHEVLPLLDDVAQRDVAVLLGRQAGVLADDAVLLDELARGIDPTDGPALAAAPLPLARRAVRTWLRGALDGHPPDADAVARVLAVARGEITATEVAGGVRVSRHRNRLRWTR
jgi:tRNA(Ile)-lysidine synthase